MFIAGKMKGAQHGLKRQCVLVPADLQKIHKPHCLETAMMNM